MMTTLILIAIVAIAHACKPALKRRAQQVDGSAAGVMAALAFTLLSVVQFALPCRLSSALFSKLPGGINAAYQMAKGQKSKILRLRFITPDALSW